MFNFTRCIFYLIILFLLLAIFISSEELTPTSLTTPLVDKIDDSKVITIKYGNNNNHSEKAIKLSSFKKFDIPVNASEETVSKKKSESMFLFPHGRRKLYRTRVILNLSMLDSIKVVKVLEYLSQSSNIRFYIKNSNDMPYILFQYAKSEKESESTLKKSHLKNCNVFLNKSRIRYDIIYQLLNCFGIFDQIYDPRTSKESKEKMLMKILEETKKNLKVEENPPVDKYIPFDLASIMMHHDVLSLDKIKSIAKDDSHLFFYRNVSRQMLSACDWSLLNRLLPGPAQSTSCNFDVMRYLYIPKKISDKVSPLTFYLCSSYDFENSYFESLCKVRGIKGIPTVEKNVHRFSRELIERHRSMSSTIGESSSDDVPEGVNQPEKVKNAASSIEDPSKLHSESVSGGSHGTSNSGDGIKSESNENRGALSASLTAGNNQKNLNTERIEDSDILYCYESEKSDKEKNVCNILYNALNVKKKNNKKGSSAIDKLIQPNIELNGLNESELSAIFDLTEDMKNSIFPGRKNGRSISKSSSDDNVRKSSSLDRHNERVRTKDFESLYDFFTSTEEVIYSQSSLLRAPLKPFYSVSSEVIKSVLTVVNENPPYLYSQEEMGIIDELLKKEYESKIPEAQRKRYEICSLYAGDITGYHCSFVCFNSCSFLLFDDLKMCMAQFSQCYLPQNSEIVGNKNKNSVSISDSLFRFSLASLSTFSLVLCLSLF